MTFDIYGQLIETTKYGVKNPDLLGYSNCFGANLKDLYHAGEDLYNSTINQDTGHYWSTEGEIVRAVADGTVIFAADQNYPGAIVVIEHPGPVY